MSDKSYYNLSQQYSGQAKDPTFIEESLCRQDRQHWLTNHFIIKDKDGQIRPMNPLKQSQIKLLKLYEWCQENNRPCRVIILKARKTGISTLIEGLMLQECWLRGIDGMVIAHNRPTAEFIYSIASRFESRYTLSKPKKSQSSVRKMTFEGEGMIMVETANNVQAGTGLTPHFIHGSEVSKWHKGSSVAVSLFQAIGDGPDTTVILESTANGYDSLFHPMWENADKYCKINWVKRDGDIFPEIDILDSENFNGYLPYFISVFDDPDYSKPFDDDAEKSRFFQTLDESEQNLMERYQVSLEQLNWYRYCLRQKCQGDIDIRRQEFPATPEEAFVSSGRNFLDLSKLNLQPTEDARNGYLIRDERWNRDIRFISDKSEDLSIFRDPVKTHRYAMGVDTAEGILPGGSSSRDPDRSVACVLDLDDGCRQVAILAGHIPEEPFSEMVALLGHYYSNAGPGCAICPEVSGYGTLLCTYLGNNYPRHMLYHRTDFLKDRPKRSRQIGWKTSITSRPILLGDLKTAINERSIIIHDKETIRELQRLQYNNRGKVEGSGGYHDDRVFALALALQQVKSYPAPLTPRRSDSLSPFSEREGGDSIDPVTGY